MIFFQIQNSSSTAILFLHEVEPGFCIARLLNLAARASLSVGKTISVKFSCSIPMEENTMEVILLPLSRSSSMRGASRRRWLLVPHPWKTRIWWVWTGVSWATRRGRRRSIATLSLFNLPQQLFGWHWSSWLGRLSRKVKVKKKGPNESLKYDVLWWHIWMCL